MTEISPGQQWIPDQVLAAEECESDFLALFAWRMDPSAAQWNSCNEQSQCTSAEVAEVHTSELCDSTHRYNIIISENILNGWTE